MNKYDYLIVGAGFSGSVLAERLNSINKKVLVIDKRNHIGGNSYDFYDENGVLIHKYGPHYFRTDSELIVNYLSKFTDWRPYNYKVRVSINGELYPFPINRNTLNQFFKVDLNTEEEAKNFLESKKVNITNPKNAEEQVLSTLGAEIYEKFFKNYTIKQWNTNPKNLDPSVTARIPLRYDTNDNYFNEKFQAMPLKGYTNLFKRLLENVNVWLNTNYFDIKNDINYEKLIFTGPIDAFFDHIYGKLPYRSLKFKSENYNQKFYQNWLQINYPNNFKFTRIVEIKHATGQKCTNTTIVKEFPSNSGKPFYPIPNPANRKKYLLYKKEASQIENVYFIGRLANYEYLNMDQVIKNALLLFNKIK
ncbi:MAG: UDP-galactopyranose mutase [Candidatus Lokiarchaeota archaeon]